MAHEELKQKQGVMWGAGSLPPDEVAALRAEMIAYGEAARDGDHIVDDREYLLVSGTRR